MSEYILVSIRQALGHEEDDKSRDEEIKNMSPDEQFQLYCQWNGLLGSWHDTLRDVVLELFLGEGDSESEYPRNNNKGPFAPF